jgi:hypothetical protein
LEGCGKDNVYSFKAKEVENKGNNPIIEYETNNGSYYKQGY